MSVMLGAVDDDFMNATRPLNCALKYLIITLLTVYSGGGTPCPIAVSAKMSALDESKFCTIAKHRHLMLPHALHLKHVALCVPDLVLVCREM